MHLGVTVDSTQAHRLLNCYAEIPGAFVDTANIYSLGNSQGPFHERGQSEQFIGSWLKSSGKRQQVILATKVKNDMRDGYPGLSKKAVAYQIDQSLQRLQVDSVDLYQIHGFDQDTSIEETLEAMNQVLQSGKARFIGCSNMNYEQMKQYQHLAERSGLKGFVSYQNPMNLILKHRLRNAEGIFLLNEVESKDLGVGLIGYRSLVNGFLSGKYQEGHHYFMESDSQKAIERNCFNVRGWNLLRVLQEIAEQKNATMTQVTLAAYRLDPKVTVSLVGFSKEEQIHEAVASLGVDLDGDDLKRIEDASMGLKKE